MMQPPNPITRDTATVDVAGTLTLEQAIALTLEHNQTLNALALQVQAERAAALQAGLLPNPALDVEVENFGGRHETSGFDTSETTVALSQSIELGGKRGKRRNQAALAADVAAWEYVEKKEALIADVKTVFNTVLADQQHLVVAGDQLRLAEQIFTAVQARVEAGKVSRLEEIRARTALSTNRIALKNAQRALETSRMTLAAFWGSQTPFFESTAGELSATDPMPLELQDLTDLALKHPGIAKRAAEVAHQEAAVKLSLAARIPDITVSAGVRRFEGTNDNALVAGFSVPLALFDRNQGAISQSRHQLDAAKADLQAAKTDILARLNQAYQHMLAAREEAQALFEDALPGAREAFEATQEGYKQGKFGFLELLDAQKTLTELTRAHIDALSAYQAALIDVTRWTGRQSPKSAIETKPNTNTR
ncbi:MAG: hypothetical protein VR64_04325 [Desulfatitalea sp. BRH_c12]|nr:MAG: hypothetical protein VR64_04325 [Desulfatitalea sp. BRH_c12]